MMFAVAVSRGATSASDTVECTRSSVSSSSRSNPHRHRRRLPPPPPRTPPRVPRPPRQPPRASRRAPRRRQRPRARVLQAQAERRLLLRRPPRRRPRAAENENVNATAKINEKVSASRVRGAAIRWRAHHPHYQFSPFLYHPAPRQRPPLQRARALSLQ